MPVIGATIIIEGTTTGTTSDIDGNFMLSNVRNDAVLHISYIGYVTQTIAVAGQTSIQIILREDTQALDKLIVVGYGVQKKSDVTGALSRVTEKQIKERPVQNALQALQGKVIGVDISSNNRSGELASIRIRGNRSINASNEPCMWLTESLWHQARWLI